MRHFNRPPLLFNLLVILCLLSFYRHGDNLVNNGLRRLLAWPTGQQTTVPGNNPTTVSPQPISDKASLALGDRLHLELKLASVTRRVFNPYQKLVLVNVGTAQGVEVGTAMISKGYLVGIVTESSHSQSWVKLVSDPSFRLAVVVDGVAGQSILKGGSSSLIVDRIPPTEDLSGRQVSTFGTDGPSASLPIGSLTSEVDRADQLVLKRYLLDRPLREEYISTGYVVKGLPK